MKEKWLIEELTDSSKCRYYSTNGKKHYCKYAGAFKSDIFCTKGTCPLRAKGA